MRLPANQHSVLCRPRTWGGHMPTPEDVIMEILHFLFIRGVYWTVFYKEPNFFVQSRSAHGQVQILALSPMRTPTYVLDLVPWCREHELAQLPWIIDGTDEDAMILINPLTILPIHSGLHRKGLSVLKDDFANSLRLGYDLRMPDFSHMIISDLIHYYHSKHEALIMCRQVASCLECLVKEFYPRLDALTQSARTEIRLLGDRASNRSKKEIYKFYEELLADTTTRVLEDLSAFDGLLSTLHRLPDGFVDLSGYKHVPRSLEVPMAAAYTKRLDTIYEKANLHVYGDKRPITEEEDSERKFQAYRTVRNRRYRYRGLSTKTPAMVRTSAIYDSLKIFTNIRGYQIVDLNHQTLSNMISSINKNNVEIGLLEYFVFTIKVHSGADDDAYTHLQSMFASASYGISDEALALSIDDVVAAVQQHCEAVKQLRNDFVTYQANYFSIHLEGESPALKPSHWIRERSKSSRRQRR